MTGLLVNMNLWENLLKHREFDAAVDHVAVTQIMKAKTEPATTRIMRLLDRLSAYSFNLYYVKGRDMILADYLSRHRNKDLDSSELIPISFCCMNVFRSLLETEHGLEVYNIGTRSSTKASGEKPPEVHGADKPLDPNLKPEHQSRSKLPSIVGTKSPTKSPTKTQTPKRSPRKSVTPEEIPMTSYETDPIQDLENTFSDTPQVVTKPVSKLLPPTSPVTQMTPKRVLSSIPEGDEERENKIEILRRKYRKALNPTPTEGIDVGDSEEILDPQIRIPDQSDFELPPPLQDMVDPSKITHKFLPKQGEIDRLINQISKKVLRDTKLSMNLRDLRAAYLQSPHFRDIYLNLTQNKGPLGKGAAKRLEQNARNYLILDGLLFKIIELEDGRLDRVLCIPTSKVHILLDTYHSSLIGGHSGITKCYQTISQRFYCPKLAENLRAYITGCHICQMFKKGKNFQRPYQKRMNINIPAMTKISMDIKQMPVNRGYSHILVLLCEVSNYMVALPLSSTRTQNILEAFQRGYLAYFGPPTHIICDQDPAFTSSLIEALVTQLNIKVILVSPTNHKSLQAEHGIKSLSGLLVKHLSQVWSWHSCLPYSMLCYNGYSTPNLNGYSPYELVFGHKMTLSQELELKVDTVVSGTFTDYYEKLKKNLKYMEERLQKFRSQRLDMLNRNRQCHAFEIGEIVYMYQARGSMVQTGSRKIACFFVGPLVIYKAVGPNQFLLMSLDGQIYPHLIEETMLKPGTIWTSKGNVTTLVELRQALSTGLKIKTK